MPSPKRRRRRLSLDDDDADRIPLFQKTASSRQLSFELRRTFSHPSRDHDRDRDVLRRTSSASDDEVGDREDHDKTDDDDDDDEVEHCAICLSPIHNKTVITPCLHSLFCWECIRAWSDQSRKASHLGQDLPSLLLSSRASPKLTCHVAAPPPQCPLCLGPFKELIYNIRSNKDFQTHHLVPLRSPSTSTAAEDHRLLAISSSRPASSTSHRRPSVTSLPRYALYGRRNDPATFPAAGMDEATWREQVNERALERRRFVYRQGLFAKHVASNRYTGFKPVGPDKLKNNAIRNKVLVFVRRELQVFSSVDVAFLTTYILSIASQLDLRSAAAIRLLADFVPQAQAEHLAHEIVTFARSPFDKLEDYDRFVQYGRPEKVEVPRGERESDRNREPRFGNGVDSRRRWEASNGRHARGDDDSRWARRDPYDRRANEGSQYRQRDRYDRANDHRDARRRSPSAPHSPVLAARPPPRAPSRHSMDRPPSRPSSRCSNLDSTRSAAMIEPGADEISSDILSLFGTPLREPTPPPLAAPPPTNGSTCSTPHAPDASAGAAKFSLSIFGIANSPAPIVDTVERTKSKTTLNEVAPVEPVSNDSPEPSSMTEARSPESKKRSSTISREVLQSRLMAEYSTAFSNKITPPVVAEISPSSRRRPPTVLGPSSPPLPKTITNWAARGQLASRGLELKQKLIENRRRAEWIAKSQVSPKVKERQNIDENTSSNIPYETSKMVYSDAKRQLLLERLEREKRLVAQTVSPSPSLSESSTIASTETALASEALLRRTLQANKSEKRAGELKERLYKKRLMRESKGKVEGRGQA